LLRLGHSEVADLSAFSEQRVEWIGYIDEIPGKIGNTGETRREPTCSVGFCVGRARHRWVPAARLVDLDLNGYISGRTSKKDGTKVPLDMNFVGSL
jgi:hypothetical protein